MDAVDLIQKEIEAILEMPKDNDFYDEAVELIYNNIHKNNGKIVAAGIGKAGHIGHNIAMTLSSTGTRSVFVHPTEAQHGDMGIVGENDVLLLMSNSGKTREVLEFIEISKKIYPSIKIISITGNNDSELAKKSDVVLYTGKTEELDRFKLVPTISTTIMSIIGDILVVKMMEKINFDKGQYQLLHHSGYISVKLKS